MLVQGQQLLCIMDAWVETMVLTHRFMETAMPDHGSEVICSKRPASKWNQVKDNVGGIFQGSW